MRRLEAAVALAVILAGCASGGEKQDAPARASNHLSTAGSMYVERAQSYLQQNDIAKATELANLALASDPGSADVHALMGMLYEQKGDAGKAEKEFDRALKIAPSNGPILNAHAIWLCAHGKADRADQEFVLALQDSSYQTPFQALFNAGRCAQSVGQWAKSETYLRRALAISPQDRLVLLFLAAVELRQGKILEARAFIQRRDALGSDAETLELAARIEDAGNDRLAAARYRKRLADEFPNHAPTGEGARTP
jgi:type IV pilus assembly protein PilF